jgi:hypothetical protein
MSIYLYEQYRNQNIVVHDILPNYLLFCLNSPHLYLFLSQTYRPLLMEMITI